MWSHLWSRLWSRLWAQSVSPSLPDGGVGLYWVMLFGFGFRRFQSQLPSDHGQAPPTDGLVSPSGCDHVTDCDLGGGLVIGISLELLCVFLGFVGQFCVSVKIKVP